MTVDDLKELFGVTDDQDLGPIFDRKKGAVSAWRKNGVPASIERAARRLLAEKGLPAPQKEDTKKADLSPEDEENLGLIRKLNERKRRELKAELYRLLAEQERDALKGE